MNQPLGTISGIASNRCPEPKQASQADQTVMRLSHVIAGLSESIGALASKLSPIVSPTGTVQSEKALPVDRKPVSALLSAIEDCSDKIEAAFQRINQLRDSVEL